ncbi:alpha/beta fold hydrolase [Pseudomonas fluorescens]|uniref:alpha/beta fold hydrolase n=1 Tax=Pseudomonas fluorescens TaxID=294 RepID=UPI0019049671|nr:alpha/beta fold hydrolase [Pseudomonas fluorescens]MBD8094599.1 alpha/beta fold hydrolase [Pseudomonas fluorescens]MBD8720490.1 alpha/beta fold hydrolase [Pseudomonas fluorescens]
MSRHIVLIHGAWQGSWAFSAWRPLLQGSGWIVHNVDLPGNGWGPTAEDVATPESYYQHVCALIDSIDEPVVLLGHSGGGVIASQVAEMVPERISALVYLVGMMLPSNMSFADFVKSCTEERPELDFSGINQYLEVDPVDQSTRVPTRAALNIFLHDCPPEAAATAASLLRRQPASGRNMPVKLSPQRYGRVPRVYIEATADRSIDIYLQRRMQQLSPGAQIISLNCGHVPQLAQPRALTDALNNKLHSLLRLNTGA